LFCPSCIIHLALQVASELDCRQILLSSNISILPLYLLISSKELATLEYLALFLLIYLNFAILHAPLHHRIHGSHLHHPSLTTGIPCYITHRSSHSSPTLLHELLPKATLLAFFHAGIHWHITSLYILLPTLAPCVIPNTRDPGCFPRGKMKFSKGPPGGGVGGRRIIYHTWARRHHGTPRVREPTLYRKNQA
jgi:hypothetical protein